MKKVKLHNVNHEVAEQWENYVDRINHSHFDSPIDVNDEEEFQRWYVFHTSLDNETKTIITNETL